MIAMARERPQQARAHPPHARTRPPRDRKGTVTRTAILDRAVDLASIDGLEGVTIGRLASELEMSKSGLFAHFGSKEELQLATVDHAARRFAGDVVVPAQQFAEGRDRLSAYVSRYLASLENRTFEGGCFWAAAATEFDDRPGAVRDAVIAGLQSWLGELERQARIGGVERPDELAFEIYSLGLGANAYARLLGDPAAFSRARTGIERRIAAVSRS
jgi:AcrR family transcriptional regulator